MEPFVELLNHPATTFLGAAMHHHLYFNQDCPICHRGMRVPIEWFGTEIRCVCCSHAGSRQGAFEARSGSSQTAVEPGCRAAAREADGGG